MILLRVVIPGEPIAQGRPRFARRGPYVVAYDPPRSRSWKQCAQAHMAAAMTQVGASLFSGPVKVTITARFSCPRSEWRKREPLAERPHVKRPDLENVIKAILDAGTGVVWHDDSQVSALDAQKLVAAQGAAPSVEMWVQGEAAV
jgi:Holliday junction resolvase RusA-like endonuclease